MIISIQRVIHPHTNARSVTCRRWAQDPSLQVRSPLERLAHPGQLAWHDPQVSTAGFRVLSYVDIVASEDVTKEELVDALTDLVDLVEMPGSYAPVGSRVGFHLDMAEPLRDDWESEVLRLVEHFLAVHP